MTLEWFRFLPFDETLQLLLESGLWSFSREALLGDDLEGYGAGGDVLPSDNSGLIKAPVGVDGHTHLNGSARDEEGALEAALDVKVILNHLDEVFDVISLVYNCQIVLLVDLIGLVGGFACPRVGIRGINSLP